MFFIRDRKLLVKEIIQTIISVDKCKIVENPTDTKKFNTTSSKVLMETQTHQDTAAGSPPASPTSVCTSPSKDGKGNKPTLRSDPDEAGAL